MSAVLHSVTDPRSNLDRARRMELFRFAQEKGLKDIQETMPADLMRQILRNKGITSIAIPQRQLGAMQQEFTTPTSHKTGAQPPRQQPDQVVEVDAVEDLARQWTAQQQPAAAKPVEAMTITEARRECKRRNIKFARTDKLVALKAMLNGQ